MTLQEIIKILQDIALTQPNVRSVGEGDIYDTLNAEGSTRYAYFFITQNKHTQTEDTDRYSLNVFYIDRLEDDKSNKLQIQSIGKEVLSNIFNTFADDFDADFSGVDFQVFTERFSDYCAGVYATVTFEVMRDGSCPDYYGDKYVPFIPIKIINQTKRVDLTANGLFSITYDPEFTGLDKVEVNVDVDVTQYIEQGRQEGYDNGYTQGQNEGYGQGYTNGYAQGQNEGYGQGYTNGYAQGETEGISQGIGQGRQQVINESEALYVENNGIYQGENLYNKVEVNVPIKAYDAETGINISFQYSDMTAIPDYIDFEGKTNWLGCFEQCKNLQSITTLRGIKLNRADSMLYYCSSLTDLSVADTWDFSDCTRMDYMLGGTGITDLSVTSKWDTSKVTNMSYLLSASNLQTVGTLDCTSITSYSVSPMYYCSTKLKNLGGFLNIKCALNTTYATPNRCPDLTKESYINIFNGLYDFTVNGETPNSSQGKIKLHSNAYTFLTDDDIAIATNKGWTVS